MSPRKSLNPKNRKGYSGKKISEFCIRVRKRRQEIDMTQETLGKKVGLTKSRISEIEAGRFPTHPDKIILLADALDVTLDALFGRTFLPMVAKQLEVPQGLSSEEFNERMEQQIEEDGDF